MIRLRIKLRNTGRSSPRLRSQGRFESIPILCILGVLFPKNSRSLAQAHRPQNFSANPTCVRLLTIMRIPPPSSTTSALWTRLLPPRRLQQTGLIWPWSCSLPAPAKFLAPLLQPIHQRRIFHPDEQRKLCPAHPALILLRQHRLPFPGWRLNATQQISPGSTLRPRERLLRTLGEELIVNAPFALPVSG